jgi:hypothetical protein
MVCWDKTTDLVLLNLIDLDRSNILCQLDLQIALIKKRFPGSRLISCFDVHDPYRKLLYAVLECRTNEVYYEDAKVPGMRLWSRKSSRVDGQYLITSMIAFNHLHFDHMMSSSRVKRLSWDMERAQFNQLWHRDNIDFAEMLEYSACFARHLHNAPVNLIRV